MNEIFDELIAHFMGLKVSHTNVMGTYILSDDLNEPPYIVRYSKSYDALIPVVRKIDTIIDEKIIELSEDKELDDPTGWRAWSYRRVTLTTKLSDVYDQVVEFIKFYNESNIIKPKEKYIDYEGTRYWYEHKSAKNNVDICLATTDPEKYCNGTYLYSDKDPGTGREFVVIKTEKLIFDDEEKSPLMKLSEKLEKVEKNLSNGER